jgi:tetratricopeptide (TPR) repeat protein
MPRVALVAVVLASLLGSAAAASAEESPDPQLYTRLLHSTAWIVTPSGSGSGWVLDRGRGLLVTNYHVVLNTEAYGLHDSVFVVFPVLENGKPVAERSYYLQNRDRLVAEGRAVLARVIDASESRDLALLAVDHLPEDVTAVTLAAESPSPGNRVHSIGNPGSSDALWIYTNGYVRQVYFKDWRSRAGKEFLHEEAHVVETQSPINPGDSGGPVVSDRGELVGVTQGEALGANLLSLAIEVSEVRAYLADVDWMVQPRTAQELSRRARHYRDTRPYRKELALADLNAAIALQGDDPDLHLERADLYEFMAPLVISEFSPFPDQRAREERDRILGLAIVDCDKALELRPGYALAYAQRAHAHWYRHENDQAQADCARALALDPDCVPAYKMRALLPHPPGAPSATQDYTEAIRRRPDDPELYESRAQAYFAEGDPAHAVADMDAAIRLRPKQVSSYRLRAMYSEGAKDWQSAVADYTRAVQLEPESPYNYQFRAKAYLGAGQPDKAVEDYTLALQVIDELKLQFESQYLAAELLEERGDIFAAGGAAERAREDYKAALRLGSIDSNRERLRQKLANLGPSAEP